MTFDKERLTNIKLRLIEVNDHFQQMVLPESDIKHLLEATVELTKAKQQYVNHLCVENAAKEIFDALANSVMQVRQESLFGKQSSFDIGEHCENCNFDPEANRITIERPTSILLERLFNQPN